MGVGKLEVAHLLGEGWRGGHAQRAQARARKADTSDLEELTTAEVHRALLIRWKSGALPDSSGQSRLRQTGCRHLNSRQGCRIHHDNRPSALAYLCRSEPARDGASTSNIKAD
ncbi:hypothetical protein D3C73_1309570 [compost metagenome]